MLNFIYKNRGMKIKTKKDNSFFTYLIANIKKLVHCIAKAWEDMRSCAFFTGL